MIVKKKIANLAVDLLLIMLVFMLTDWVMLRVLHSEKLLPEVLVYLVLYGVVFGAKRLLMVLWNKRKQNETNK